MKDGFLKAAALSPALRVADCAYNTRQILTELRAAAARGVKLAVFPEFCLTGYTCGDLFLQRTLQQGALTGLQELLDASRELDTVALVGLPLMVRGKLYNCAAVFCRGQLLGLVPKTYLPNYGEFYEKRQFTPGSTEVEWVNVCGQDVPFGTSLLFRCRQMPSFVLGVELCEDLWSALPPSTFHALAGATVIANLSASDETVGKAEYRRALVENQSARLLCGYLYASAGHGESTQDMVFAGHDLIAENGTLLAEVKPFAGGLAETELDCQRMESERARNTSFEPSTEGYQTVEFDLALTDTVLTRWVDPTPFIPHNEQLRAERCELILKMQADGLAKRLRHGGKLVGAEDKETEQQNEEKLKSTYAKQNKLLRRNKPERVATRTEPLSGTAAVYGSTPRTTPRFPHAPLKRKNSRAALRLAARPSDCHRYAVSTDSAIVGMPSARTRITHTTTVKIFFILAERSRCACARASRSFAALMRSLFCCAVSFCCLLPDFLAMGYSLSFPRISMTRAMCLATSTSMCHLSRS